MSDIRARRLAVWNNNPPKRYLPMAVDGGPEWMAWDAAQKRHLRDDELFAIPLETIKTELIS